MYIIRIIGDTALFRQKSSIPSSFRPLLKPETNPVPSLATRPTFGFTAGATKTMLDSIMMIKDLSSAIESGHGLDYTKVVSICRRLEECRHLCSRGTAWEEGDLQSDGTTAFPYKISVVTCLLNAFIAATYIYLHRALFDAKPFEIKTFVAEVLQNIKKFLELRGGNLTVWPAFVAAVEACDDADLEAAKTWLDEAMQVGMGNRTQVRTVVEEVWRRRRDLSQKVGLPLDQCCIDWREVMQDLDIDILLV